MQLGHQFGGQLDAVGIDLEAALEDLATAGDHVQIAAGGLGVDDPAPAILQLFETAAAALFAEGIPLLVVIRSIAHHEDTETALSQLGRCCSGNNARGRRAEVWKMMQVGVGMADYYCPRRRGSTTIPICPRLWALLGPTNVSGRIRPTIPL